MIQSDGVQIAPIYRKAGYDALDIATDDRPVCWGCDKRLRKGQLYVYWPEGQRKEWCIKCHDAGRDS